MEERGEAEGPDTARGRLERKIRCSQRGHFIFYSFYCPDTRANCLNELHYISNYVHIKGP